PNVVSGVEARDGSRVTDGTGVHKCALAVTLVGLGTNTITVTASDEAGNSASCTTTFTVTDTTVPTVSCPAPTSASADGACQAARSEERRVGKASRTRSSTTPDTVSQSPSPG